MKRLILIVSMIFILFASIGQVKIYNLNGTIMIEDLYPDIVSINPGAFDWRVTGPIYYARDEIQNQSYTLGQITNITDFNGNPFVNDEQLINYLNNLSRNTPSGDVSGRTYLNTIFGDQITGIRKTSIGAQFQYGVEDGESDVVINTTGTVSIVEALLTVSTGTDAAGAARIQSTETVRYVPGQEMFAFFTVVFSEPQPNSFQRAGLYDDANGFFISYEDTDTSFYFVRRRASAIDTTDFKQRIDLDDFEKKNGYRFDPKKGNIYRISYGYLGFAPISLEVSTPSGGFALMSRIEYPNSSTVTHTTQTYLPVRAEVANTGNTTDIVLKSGSIAAGVTDGGDADVAGRQFTWANDQTFIFSDSTTLVTFRNKTTFAGIENRVPARLLLVTGANESNKNLKWRLLKNPTLEASPVPVWVDVDTNNSTLEYSVNAVVNYDLSTDLFLAWNAGKIEDFLIDVETYTLDLPPGRTASFVIYSGATNAEVDISIRWNELF